MVKHYLLRVMDDSLYQTDCEQAVVTFTEDYAKQLLIRAKKVAVLKEQYTDFAEAVFTDYSAKFIHSKHRLDLAEIDHDLRQKFSDDSQVVISTELRMRLPEETQMEDTEYHQLHIDQKFIHWTCISDDGDTLTTDAIDIEEIRTFVRDCLEGTAG